MPAVGHLPLGNGGSFLGGSLHFVSAKGNLIQETNNVVVRPLFAGVVDRGHFIQSSLRRIYLSVNFTRCVYEINHNH